MWTVRGPNENNGFDLVNPNGEKRAHVGGPGREFAERIAARLNHPAAKIEAEEVKS